MKQFVNNSEKTIIFKTLHIQLNTAYSIKTTINEVQSNLAFLIVKWIITCLLFTYQRDYESKDLCVIPFNTLCQHKQDPHIYIYTCCISQGSYPQPEKAFVYFRLVRNTRDTVGNILQPCLTLI